MKFIPDHLYFRLSSRLSNVNNKLLRHIKSAFYSPFSDRDLFVAAYPKSGVTFLSSVLEFITNCDITITASLDHGLGRYLDFDRFLRSSTLHPPHLFTNKLFILKTHMQYKPYMRNTIVLLRDPRKALPSHYRFVCERNTDYQCSFDDFLLDEDKGIQAWRDMYLSYLHSCESSRVAFLRYEDIISNHHLILACLSEYFSIQGPTSSNLDDAFEYFSLQSSSLREKNNLKYDPRANWNSRGLFSSHSSPLPVWSSHSERLLRSLVPADLLALFKYDCA